MAVPGGGRRLCQVSCFRWRDGVYLVLEYAARGDLHSLVTNSGSLDEPSARFVLGEV